ncbi:MAG: RNA polymerase sigma factor [Nocardioidaceae bacterium]
MAQQATLTPVRDDTRPTSGDGRRAALVRAAARGDRPAWNALVREFSGLVWAVARAHGLGQADAADVSQTTWLRLVEHFDRINDPERLGAWLATTARREALRVRRVAQAQPPTDQLDELDSPDEVAVEARLLTRERDAALWQAFARLPERDRALLRLLVAEPQPSYKDVAAALGMPVGSIGPTRARCIERLRCELERVSGDSGPGGRAPRGDHGGALDGRRRRASRHGSTVDRSA